MKKLKIVAPEWANYTGSLGMVHFTDGLSDQFIADHIRRRLSIGMAMVEVDAEGNEEPASPTHKMIASATIRAAVNEPLTRQSDSDKAQELLDIALSIDANTPTHTKEQLEKIADKEGIKGLRDIADHWHVKSRSIPDLINAILDAQERFVINRQKHHVERISEELANNEALKQAALTGDLSAAINAGAQQQEQAQEQETQGDARESDGGQAESAENNIAEPTDDTGDAPEEVDTGDASVSESRPVEAAVSDKDNAQIELEDFLLNLPENTDKPQ